MAETNARSSDTAPPTVTEVDLYSFHTAHFSRPSIFHFSTQFFGPVEHEATEEEDDLGYYPDGVKRTLTDEQIVMFRHSEIQALLRERRHAAEAGRPASEADLSQISAKSESEDGELGDSIPFQNSEHLEQETLRQEIEGTTKVATGGKKKRQQQKKSNFKQYVKPDLRKRTWDKVELGLESLDYGEENNPVTIPPQQRKRISYDDV